MESYRFVVFSNSVEGKDEEYNTWYSNQHIQDVVKLYGFSAAQRFVLEPHPRNEPADLPFKYMAIYEIETDDLQKTFADLASASNTERMPVSDTLARPLSTMVMKPITKRVRKEDVTPG